MMLSTKQKIRVHGMDLEQKMLEFYSTYPMSRSYLEAVYSEILRDMEHERTKDPLFWLMSFSYYDTETVNLYVEGWFEFEVRYDNEYEYFVKFNTMSQPWEVSTPEHEISKEWTLDVEQKDVLCKAFIPFALSFGKKIIDIPLIMGFAPEIVSFAMSGVYNAPTGR